MNRNSARLISVSSSSVFLFTVGFISILGQVVILRELDVAFYGVELIYTLSIGIWLFGTAIGAAAGRRAHVPDERFVQNLFLLTTAVLIIDIAFIRGFRRIFGGVSGEFLPFQLQMVGLTLGVLPFSFLGGLLFRSVAKRFLLKGGTLAKAYFLESAGGVLGGLSSTLLLALGIQNLAEAFFCAICSLGIVILLSFKGKFSKQIFLSTAGFAMILVLCFAASQIDRWMTSWDYPNLVESRDTPYNRVTVTSLEGQTSIFENDALSYETETTDAEELVQLSTLQAKNLDKVLVLGGGFEGVVSELSKLPVKEIDYVEINKTLIKVVDNHLPAELTRSLNDPRVKITYRDPRHYLERSNSYDVVIVVMPEPMSAENNRFYTREFFQQCAMRLNTDGVVAFRIPSAENLWTPELQNRNRSIYSAVRSAFNNVIVLPGVTNIFISSNSNLVTDPTVLIDRFRSRNLKTKLVTPEYIRYVLTNDRFTEIQRLLSSGTSAPNSDVHPACYGYTISIWLSKFFSGFVFPEERTFQIDRLVSSPAVWIVLSIGLLIAVNRKLAFIRRFLLMFLAGFAGMASEVLVLMNYQSRNGALYQDMGILLMSFMIGLALGALTINEYFGTSRIVFKSRICLGCTLIIGFALLNVAVYFAIKSDFLGTLTNASIALILEGGFVSAIFAFLTTGNFGDLQDSTIRLYSADLIGGGIGSLLATLILLPVFGILTTSLLTAATAALGLIFLW